MKKENKRRKTMEKRFEFLLGVQDNRDDSMNFIGLTAKQMKALALVLNIGVDYDKQEDTAELIQYSYNNMYDDDGFITDKFISDLMKLVEHITIESYKDEPDSEMQIKLELEGCKRHLKEIDNLLMIAD